jgi:hypothetical protein
MSSMRKTSILLILFKVLLNKFNQVEKGQFWFPYYMVLKHVFKL